MTALIYNTISDITFAYSTPSVDGTILSIIKKGVSLSIDSIANGWASYTDNNTIYYIKQSDLKLCSNSSGVITIKYIDEKTNEEIKSNLVKNELPLGEYNFAYEEICGYTLNDDISKKVILDENHRSDIIFFKYKKNISDELLTIYYVDSETNESIYETKNYTSNTLSDMCNTTVEIPGYDLLSTEITSSLIKKITYKYRKNTGSIKIMYMDENSEIELSDSDEYIDLELGKYEYTAKNISAFSVIGNETQSVILSYDDNNITIIFNYKEDYLPLDVNIQNEVPYISTYYIKPIIKLNEDVILDFYITDYYHKEYIEEDFSELFTVTIKIDGKPIIIKTNLTAGDHSINIGNFSEEKEQNFSIICTDKYGRNSHELFNCFLVRNEPESKEYIMTEEDLKNYNIKNTDDYEEIKLVTVDVTNQTMVNALTTIANSTSISSKKYVCFIGDSNNDGIRDSSWNETIVKYSSDYSKDTVLDESILTRKGLQQLLDDKKSEGYNKIKLLNGTYRVDHLSPIYIPSNFTVDLNSSTIKLNSFTGNNALMITLNNTFDSHVINGTIEGDYFTHDYTNSTNNSEWVKGISIDGESKYSSFENLTVKNITGYGSSNGIADSRNSLLSYNYASPISIGNTFKLGDIDKKTGLDISSTNRTTSDYINISTFIPYNYISVSIYLGYQGNPCGTWNILCHFYDSNKKYISSINGYQYRKILIPTNSNFLRVTILNEAYPTNLTINLFRIPTHCSFKNIIHENCRCVGMAQAAMKDMLIENCSFLNCGQSSANCAYDAEDGWDMMQDCTFKSLSFKNNPANDFLVCSGHNFTVKNFLNGKIHFKERCFSFLISNNQNLYSCYISHSTRLKSGFRRFFNNTIQYGININASPNNPKLIIKDTIINGRASNTLNTSCFLRCDIGASLSTSYGYENGLGTGNFVDCYIHDKFSSHNYGGKYINCTIKNIEKDFSGEFYFENCKFLNISILLVVENIELSFYKCSLTNFKIKYYTSNKFNGAIVNFDTCSINNSNNPLLELPHYSLNFPIMIINSTIISYSTNGVISFISDINHNRINSSFLKLQSNNISSTNSNYVITGLNSTTINLIKIYSTNNTLMPPGLLLFNPEAKECSNIYITES